MVNELPYLPGPRSPNITINSFSGRFFHELDTVNFLASGKEWYGEELSNLPGRTLTRNFPVSLPNIVTGSALTIQTQCVARSVGGGSSFDLKINNSPVQQINIAPVGTGQYDVFAQQATSIATAIASQSDLVISYTYTPGSFNAQGWLNWFELFPRQQLSMNNVNQLLFRDWSSVGNNIGEFVISNATNATQVWDITDPLSPIQMQHIFSSQ